jgi:transcription elongation factor Elf1
MSLTKRLKVIVAALKQDWHTFTCPECGAESYICGHAPDLNGLLCQACESKEFDKWMGDFNARMKGVV